MSSSSPTYRNDIDGLRAFAVLLVTVFHIDESLIPGGFVGVDMFFVISGYLITDNIVREYRLGKFSYPEFYRKRFRRILPAMLVVTATTWIVGVALMLPEDAKQLSWASLATILSVANIYFTFFLDTSYFAADSAANPLLHMWSLGVEEQFYFIWPAVLLFFLRFPRFMVPGALFLIAASIAIGEWHLRSEAFGWAYYMLPARAFELAAGGLLAYVGIPALRARHGLIVAGAGAIFVALSAIFLNGSTPFPGLYGIPVMLGTVMLIAGGACRHAISKFLSLDLLRWIGRISYSLYLWHWPVLAFQRYFTPELSAGHQIASAVIMVALADVTHRWIETPFRRTDWSFRKTMARMYLLPGAALSVGSIAVIMTAGLGPWVFTDYPAQLANSTKAAFSYDFVCQQPQLTPDIVSAKRCVSGEPTEKPRVLLYGDSNAAHYVGAFRILADTYGFAFRNVAHSACPPVQANPQIFAAVRYRSRCLRSHQIVDPTIGDFPVVALAAVWDAYDSAPTESEDGIDFRMSVIDVVQTLRRNRQKVILIGAIPRQKQFDRNCVAKSIKYPLLNCRVEAPALNSDMNIFLRELASTDDGVIYLDPFPALCSTTKCRSYNGSVSLYYDAGHLSMEGSRIVGQYWAERMSAELLSTLTTAEDLEAAKIR